MPAGETSETLLMQDAVCDPHDILVFYGTIALGADLDHVWHFSDLCLILCFTARMFPHPLASIRVQSILIHTFSQVKLIKRCLIKTKAAGGAFVNVQF